MAQKQPDGRNAEGKVCAEGSRASILSESTSLPTSPHVHQPRSSWNPVFWGFLHQDGVVDHYLYSQPFSPLKRVGNRMKNSQLLIMAWPLE